MKEHWAASTALSASLLRWLLVHSRLRFELFDHSWWCDQNRGTHQGGSHSPTLFGRIVAAALNSSLACWGVRFLSCRVVWLRTRWSPPRRSPRLALWDFRWPKWINRWSAVWRCHGCLLRQPSPSCQRVVLPVCNSCAFSMPSLRRRFGGPFVFVPQARCPSASSCSLCHPADLVAGRSCSLCLVRCGMFANKFYSTVWSFGAASSASTVNYGTLCLLSVFGNGLAMCSACPRPLSPAASFLTCALPLNRRETALDLTTAVIVVSCATWCNKGWTLQ